MMSDRTLRSWSTERPVHPMIRKRVKKQCLSRSSRYGVYTAIFGISKTGPNRSGLIAAPSCQGRSQRPSLRSHFVQCTQQQQQQLELTQVCMHFEPSYTNLRLISGSYYTPLTWLRKCRFNSRDPRRQTDELQYMA